MAETLDNGDLKIRFVGMTGARAATNELGLDDTASMDPAREIPRIFDTWEMYVREAGIWRDASEPFQGVPPHDRQEQDISGLGGAPAPRLEPIAGDR